MSDDQLQIDSAENQNQLFSQIFLGQASMQSIVDDWIELYKKDKDTAMIDLIKFLIRCSGCKAANSNTNTGAIRISKDLLKSKEFAECINDLVESFNDDEDTIEIYPLIQTSLQARRFKSNFGEFLQLLVNQCQYSIIYDQFMLDILIAFLIGLADSQVRAFRHTATMAVLKVMTALVDVLLALSIAKDACQRQHENERKKTQQKRANDRIDMLIAKRKELEENETDIQNFINFIFKAVFVHRYRDVCSDIRCVCINEIGEWMKRCPSKFLDDTFLKYIGWTLYDRVGECRSKCLQVLQPLYDKDDLNQRLELFTSRFKTRIVEMCLDKEYEVSVCAIKLLTKIISKNDMALEDKDCENLYELVFHTNRQIAHAAGEFLNQKLFLKVESNESNSDNSDSSTSNASFILLLIQFLTESEVSLFFWKKIYFFWQKDPPLHPKFG
jgi:cohesin complex subunit SA-1/2